MSSSLIDRLARQRGQQSHDLDGLSPRVPTLVEALSAIQDPRRRQGRRHLLAAVLAIALVAVLCGASSPRAIARFAATLPQHRLAAFGTWCDRRGRFHAPAYATILVLMGRLDGDAVDACLGAFFQAVAADAAVEDPAAHPVGYALDGKTVRGAKTGLSPAPHLVAVLHQGSGLVVGQRAVDAKSNEITAFAPVLDQIGDLAGAVVVADALHTQRGHAEYLHGREAYYCLPVKDNQPNLFTLLDALPWEKTPIAHEETEVSRGRRETRDIRVLPAPDGCFPYAAQVFLIERHVTDPARPGLRHVAHLGITSAPAHLAGPADLAGYVRNEWGIEVLHNIRDVTYREDASKVRTANRPRIMATLRNTAIGLIRIANWSSIPDAHAHYRENKDHALHLLGLSG